jgi:hypothetical protein
MVHLFLELKVFVKLVVSVPLVPLVILLGELPVIFSLFHIAVS